MTGARDPRDAARRATAAAPGNAVAWIVLADAELDAGDAAAGEVAVQRALALAPGHPEALARLGRLHWMRGRHREAVDSLARAARGAPRHPGIALWLGHVLEDAGQAEAAAEAYARAHALAPDAAQIAAHLLAWRRKLCDWRGLDALSAQVRGAVARGEAAVEPFAFLSEDGDAVEQLRCARLSAAQVAHQARPLPPRAMAAAGTLRVGFLSNGFGAHPTGLLTVALLEALRAEAGLEAHLFALNPDDGSAIRQRLEAATTLHDVSALPHAAVAQRIRDAGIDILHDLRGWGGGGAPGVLAMRPAPVQVNWLAYPGTSGAPWIDYVLADDVVLPTALETGFSEAVARLPRCFQPSDTRRAPGPPPSRGECGLPDAGVVFCCFNNSYKMNPASFMRAMAVLRGVPGSVLWLLSGPGRGDDRLRAAATAAGIDPARLVFMAKQPHAAYLARLQLADLFLDSNPYNAHTTASDALWAGCPVLTCPGRTFAARVAGSLNHHLGLGALNVADAAAYVELATALGRDPARLAGLRARLAGLRGSSGLFDMAGFARDFAAMARAMAARHRNGLPPAGLRLDGA
ncbi:tetratricopeptide repeat protein [Luteimonas sp. MC1750]|uniref:O-linked N-acetylglucosamine transferase, SPINDLY family protein n=1 Tax=Luteimonas sp. MC1750 TaxID=2799326 RepID=UPI0018F0FCC6|nr:tetratricopeptide repeat protein [Luteimonas sp. MC1750]MBJ6985440.1 tetratricopeptide repeat protein [Luteimonas sp. MC1750]QQO05307.1 tetratricopeptide repeat protein [Luteimonas sp. MC1750]